MGRRTKLRIVPGGGLVARIADQAIALRMRDAQPRATMRRLTILGIHYLAEQAERQLNNAGIPEPERDGTTAMYVPERPPLAYGYTPMGTYAMLRREDGRWYLIDAWRGVVDTVAGGSMARLHIKNLRTQLVRAQP